MLVFRSWPAIANRPCFSRNWLDLRFDQGVLWRTPRRISDQPAVPQGTAMPIPDPAWSS